MTNKRFDAITSKNAIAQELREGASCGELGMVKVNTRLLLTHLRWIEKYTGTGNQPSVDDVYAGEEVAPF